MPVGAYRYRVPRKCLSARPDQDIRTLTLERKFKEKPRHSTAKARRFKKDILRKHIQREL